MRKGESPDLLLMTATPIPRTLALTAFGDLEVSTIRTMPRGRRPVITHLAREGNEQKVYRRVREELDRGRQAYFVYPLIGESASPGREGRGDGIPRAAGRGLPGPPRSRSSIPACPRRRSWPPWPASRRAGCACWSRRASWRSGSTWPTRPAWWWSTPSASGCPRCTSCAGRVGRGPAQSYAFLVYDSGLTPEGVERLKIMMETTDGFRIAERDLAPARPGRAPGPAAERVPELPGGRPAATRRAPARSPGRREEDPRR